MKCNKAEPLIYLFREGELSATEKAVLDRHLIDCENCRNLYDSVVRMSAQIRETNFISGAEFPDEETTENILSRIEKQRIPEKTMGPGGRSLFIIKTLAASLLLLITLTFILEQASFSRQKSAMQLRLDEYALLSGKEDPVVDCIQKLEKKIKISRQPSLFQMDETAFNRINEEQLAQYIHEVCGQKARNINNLKQVLKQAGILTDTDTK